MKTAEYPFDLKKNGYSVLCYGGHPSLVASLDELLPGIRFMRSKSGEVDKRSFGRYDLIISFITNTSHSSNASVKQKAKRANVKSRQMVHKGAASAAAEILASLGVH